MDKYIINGGEKLCGVLEIQSAKNTVLPLLAASILTDEPVKIRGVPPINDVESMLHILSEVGCAIQRKKDITLIDSSNAASHEIPTRLTKELRSSVLCLVHCCPVFVVPKYPIPVGAISGCARLICICRD